MTSFEHVHALPAPPSPFSDRPHSLSPSLFLFPSPNAASVWNRLREVMARFRIKLCTLIGREVLEGLCVCRASHCETRATPGKRNVRLGVFHAFPPTTLIPPLYTFVTAMCDFQQNRCPHLTQHRKQVSRSGEELSPSFLPHCVGLKD